MMVIKESDTVHVRIGKEAHDKHKELVKRKYDGKTKTFTLFELTRAVKSHCKTLEKELEQKENED